MHFIFVVSDIHFIFVLLPWVVGVSHAGLTHPPTTTYLHTYPPTYYHHLPTYLPTHLPPPTYLLTYPPTYYHLPTYPHTYYHLPTYLLTHPPTYLPTYLPTHPPTTTYLTTHLPTYLPIYPSNHLFISLCIQLL